VCDRLVELYLKGGLPVGAEGEAAGLLDSYWLGRAERLPEDERRELYARVAGRSFEHLLGRLAAALAEHDPARGDDDVTWAVRELRSNVEAHVDERAQEAVPLLHAQLGDALAILSEREVLAAYGARDPWQLVDHLSRLELGGTRDVERHQTLAATGTVILSWLAEAAPEVTEDAVDAARAWLAASP
jgi:hypothetical protein